MKVALMPSGSVPDKRPRAKSPLRTAFTPPLPVSTGLSSSFSSIERVGILPLTIISFGKSDNGDKVGLRFSDRQFTFPTWWLHLSRRDEGLPSPEDGFCKNPAKICVSRVKVTGARRWATVDITWNTGTTSRFPALWLRVLGPTKALEQGRYHPRLPSPVGKDPRSGVEHLTQGEKRVRDQYRERLIDIMTEFMDEDWLLDMSTSLLREMVEYVEVELQRESLAAEALAAKETRDDAAAESSDDGTLIDEDVA